jgi:POT family proton-dependent oligopeptide transporter
MLKNHPKGLFVAFFTNMGERFGFYTMMAILVLFLQAKYGLSESEAGSYYSWFYFAIYALALIGGMLADWSKKYKLIILLGQIVMFTGYAIVAVPNMPLSITLTGLFVIALGNGFFKGNLQAVVGQLYDNPKYSHLRDSAFMVFYMGINVGAFFAPFAASAIRNWWLNIHGLFHDGSLPALCHQMVNGTLTDTTQLQGLANAAIINQEPVVDLMAFAKNYIDVFSVGYNWAFAIAAGGMILSLLVYVIFNKALPNKEKLAEAKKENQAPLSPVSILKQWSIPIVLLAATTALFHLLGLSFGIKEFDYKFGLAVGLFVAFVSYMFIVSTKEEKPRILSLCLVFIVVIFFWMSFHQNGLTLNFFARDYTVKEVGSFTNLFFTLLSILCVIATIGGLIVAITNKNNIYRIIAGIVTLGAGFGCYYYVTNIFGSSNPISPEVFQSFNPLFIVALTPLVMGVFAYLKSKDKEPSTPRKIGYGMIIAALGFVVVLVASLKLISPYLLGGAATPDSSRVTPYWLMSSYLILTIAELFLSPMGLSFVSKVAPSRFQGLMQGGWLLATAIGNKFLFVGSLLWERIDLYMLWGIFIICCILSALLIFYIIKSLENSTK